MQRFLLILVAVAVLLGGGFVAWQHFEAAQLPAEINGDKVAAYVNSVPIFESQLDQAMATTSPSDALRSEVLSALINNEILTEAGLKRGLAPDSLVRTTMDQQKARAAKDPKGKEVIAAAAKQLNIEPAKYWDDPRVFESYRRIVALNEMQKYILGQLYKDKQKDQQAVLKAIGDFVATEHADVVIK